MNEIELNRMGKGWFILKLAEDNGISIKTSTNYGTQSAMRARLSYYETTRKDHKLMLLEVVNNWNKRIVGGNPNLTNQEIYDIAILLLDLFKLTATPVNKKPINRGIVTRRINVNKAEKEFPFNECDRDEIHVRYDVFVEDGEKVEGLCSYLDKYYNSIIDHIKRLFNVPDLFKIDVILSKKCEKDPVHNDVAEWIKNQFRIYGNDLSKKRINEIIDNKYVEMPITGEFIRDTERPRIIIYFRNTYETDRKKYFRKVLMTFAHEYFHFFHYLYTKGNNIAKEKWKQLSVNESLAEIFAFDYLSYNSTNNQLMLNVANERYNFWIKYFGSKVPYAQALRYFSDDQNINYIKIGEVLNMSAIDMNDAYKILIR